jgi:outer membrane lipopolysaccharide assembly protein LptE/RlpB|tara:strand:+ start:41 stop:511 length:471 start_codon:yes stop_codon:yes gene_type:complete
MNKKIILSLVFTLLIGCGFTPMLKDFDVSDLKIQKINYTGKNELVYLLKTYIILQEKENPKGMIVNLNVSESIATSTKNASGIVVEEDLTLSVGIEILDSEKRILLSDSVSNSRRIAVTSNLSSDEETTRNERRNLLQNLSQKIKFKLQLIAKRQQ